MGAPRLVPSDSILGAWRDEGLTVRQMVARIRERDGVTVSEGTIYSAMSRAGLTERKRYDEFVPWRVREEHANDYPLVMLRIAARVAAGEVLPLWQAKKYVSWVERLRSAGAVVHYEPTAGWFYVPARPGIDTGLIRVPTPLEEAS